MKLPRIWRKKKAGKYGGSWFAKINGADVNLSTKNAQLAESRLLEALKGRREWPTDGERGAAALEPVVAGAAAGDPVPYPTPAPAAAPPAPDPAPPAPAAAVVVVPEVVSTGREGPSFDPGAEARAEAEATNAAAAETAGGEPDPGAPPPFTADALKGMLQTCAGVLVEGQLALQAWAIERKTGKRPAPVPDSPDFPLRKIAADAWAVQFERWFPNMGDVPPWVLAAGLPLLALPVQLATAKPPEKEAGQASEPPPVAEAA